MQILQLAGMALGLMAERYGLRFRGAGARG